jgi:hypothetical protein
MSDDDDMSDKTMKSGYNRISKGGMMPESTMKQSDDMLSKTGKGNMMSDNIMPKSDAMPMDNMMPKSNAIPMDNMMPKSNAMPMDNMMPKSNTMPMDNMMPKSNTMPKSMTKVNQNSMNSVQNQTIQYKALYPEVFYKVKPYVLMVCDELENMGQLTPNQEDIENIADNICADVRDMYPELGDYIEQTEAQETFVPFYGRRFGQPFRRRGIFNDLVGIMLLGELYGRRRGCCW